MRYATLCFCIGIAALADPPAFARTDTGTQQRPKRPDQPRATLAASWSAPAALSGASGDMQAWYASVNTSFKPHPFKSGLLSPGLDYRHARYRFDGAAPPLADRSLHAIQLPLDYRTARADSRWGWWARIAPELATDFEHVDEHDLNLTLIGSARYAAGERLQLLLGVFASTHFGDVIAFPAPGLIWNRGPNGSCG